ncbi:5-methylcytosine restriction system specificity protein McrC [Psychrobacter celer]|uniref:5-methylcytosine restriction system specificity protein McrC n=1 Tax=Psychrobacter celer TaxID=306572 RepID=UPI003FD5A8D6
MSKLIRSNHLGTVSEHKQIDFAYEEVEVSDIFFQDNEKNERCVQVVYGRESLSLKMSYFIGADWLVKNQQAIYVAPKINKGLQEIDYLGMLQSCLTHGDIAKNTKDLYHIKLNEPFIEIDQQMDLLTPLLVMQFLQILKILVKKGLKQSYYKVERNLNSRIKGKVLIAQNIKKNIVRNRVTNTFCSYEEFGFDSIENRVLKHTLSFVRRYLSQYPEYLGSIKPLIDYCTPAFQSVSDEVNLYELKAVKRNSFYKEYQEALKLSKIILKRFGYHISEIDNSSVEQISVPPFWIDMSKLFELYVLGLLKDKYGDKILFQAKGSYGNPDYLLIDDMQPLIIDAKYRPTYQQDKNLSYIIDDIRQISGYARDVGILDKLGYHTVEEQSSSVVSCVIIYTDQDEGDKLPNSLTDGKSIKGFTKFYKVPISAPVLKNQTAK